MTSETKFHVLLIGVDEYAEPLRHLYGAVNDIDAIQRLLIDQAKIPMTQIKRLASAHPDAKHETVIPSLPATLKNMRAAFTELGSERVGPNDRVFVYYAGHGGRAPVEEGDRKYYRESLVTSDAKWLVDFELNNLIARIASRTQAVTIILDCCQSAGVTRALSDSSGDSRSANLEDAFGRGAAAAMSAEAMKELEGLDIEVLSGLTAGVDQIQVIAGCFSHESAYEEKTEELRDNDIKHGRLTRSMMNALGGMSEDEIKTVPWGRIWHKMREEVENAEPRQHLWMSGNLAREVLAGPPVDGDVGLRISRGRGNVYHIEAGTLSDINVGARLAVYADKPFKFPPLDSPEDKEARVSDVLLKVTAASRGAATAEAEGVPFDLPPGARGRLVQAGADEKLRCAVVPADEKLVAALAASPLLEVTSEQAALVRLEQQADGNWVLTDDLHGAGGEDAVLFNLGKDPVGSVRNVVEHYRSYSLPIRMAQRCKDLPGALRVRLLASEGFDRVPTEAEVEKLREIPTNIDAIYQLGVGQEFCIRVDNTSKEDLRVVMLDSAGSGCVEFLGDQVINEGSSYVFWHPAQIGQPFQATVSEGSKECIDRLVAIGTTSLDKDLKHLEVVKSFADAAQQTRGSLGNPAKAKPPVEQWTATHTIMRMG